MWSLEVPSGDALTVDEFYMICCREDEFFNPLDECSDPLDDII